MIRLEMVAKRLKSMKMMAMTKQRKKRRQHLRRCSLRIKKSKMMMMANNKWKSKTEKWIPNPKRSTAQMVTKRGLDLRRKTKHKLISKRKRQSQKNKSQHKRRLWKLIIKWRQSLENSMRSWRISKTLNEIRNVKFNINKHENKVFDFESHYLSILA